MKEMSGRAKILILGVIVFGLLSILQLLFQMGQFQIEIVVLAILASLTQIYKVEGATNKTSYNLAWVVYGFTFAHLGAPAAIIVLVIAHLAEWIRHKYPWFIQTYNIATYAIAILGADLAYNAIQGVSSLASYATPLALFVGIGVFTLINHFVIGMVIWFARGQNFTQSGVFGSLTLMIDFTLMALGVASAFVWGINPMASLFVLAPIYLLHTSLRVPSLKREAEIDPKTHLYNAKYFSNSFEKELERALRYNSPLTLVMGDLDLLRNINNTYGHLAGDVVLIGIAEILQKSFRAFDLVARFGGEEFAIMMPNTPPEEVLDLVEAVRESIVAADFEVDTSILPIKASMSFGISGIQGALDAPVSTKDLINDADSALYNAKLGGRNQTVLYSNRNIEELFHIKPGEERPKAKTPIESRYDSSKALEPPATVQAQPRPESTHKVRHQPSMVATKQSWQVNLYIGLVALAAVGIGFLGVNLFPFPRLWGILVFSLLIFLSEMLSIEIYTRDSTVSTAAAPLIAGALLLGPVGALVLSIVIAVTATLKKRSEFIRLVFNTSNHFISSSLTAFLVLLLKDPFREISVGYQLAISLISGIIVYFSSTLLLTGVLHFSKRQPFLQIWKEHFNWLLPYYIAFGLVAFAMIVGYNHAGFLGLFAIMGPLLMLRFSQYQYINNTKAMVNQLHQTNEELEQNNKIISEVNEDILLSLANTIDLRDSHTMGHSNNVAHIVSLVTQSLGLPKAQAEVVRKAAMLHDIGKIGIPDSILFKPAELTRAEFDAIKEHPVRGAEIVEANISLRELGPAIRHHHERYDGMGYPDGLKGEAIPLEARILCLADSVQAMLSDRPYRKGLPLEDAIVEIEANAGTHFDPQIAGIFLRTLKNEKPIRLTAREVSPEFETINIRGLDKE